MYYSRSTVFIINISTLTSHMKAFERNFMCNFRMINEIYGKSFNGSFTKLWMPRPLYTKSTQYYLLHKSNCTRQIYTKILNTTKKALECKASGDNVILTFNWIRQYEKLWLKRHGFHWDFVHTWERPISNGEHLKLFWFCTTLNFGSVDNTLTKQHAYFVYLKYYIKYSFCLSPCSAECNQKHVIIISVVRSLSNHITNIENIWNLG